MNNMIGKMLDNRYELLEVIGSGGMAVVYKAKCHYLNRLVAIKILKSDLAQDEAGAALEELIEAQGWTVASHVVVRDDVSEIGDAIAEAADECHANVVLTCGGTGLSMRDVTPEATRAVCERDVPGIAEAIRAYSMTKTRRAMLSRAICMQRGHTLVVNFPGSTKAARESWEAIADQLEHAAQMTAGGGHTN